MIFIEDELLPISLLQHLLFCERRAALVQIEGIWDENVFTAEGAILHSKVDADHPVESRVDVRIARGLQLRSLRLGLTGRADVVEFHRVTDEVTDLIHTAEGLKPSIPFSGVPGLWCPYPVDYKRGRLRCEEGFEIQLCAQALCLEEMMGVAVPAGAIFFGKPHRRLKVLFDSSIRKRTEQAAHRMHELIRSNQTPPARYERKCKSCSLFDICMPRVTEGSKSVSKYLTRMLGD